MEKEHSEFEAQVMYWIAEKKNFLLTGLLALIILLFIGTQWIQKKESFSEKNFIKTNKNLALLHEGSAESINALNELKTMSGQQAGLDGAIAQGLLAVGEPKTATPYLDKALSPITKNDFPDYATFSNVSICIDEKDFRRALKDSSALNTEANTFLQAFNSLRIAMLYQKLGEWENEKSAWKKFQELTKDPKILAMIQTFSQEKIPLEPYIQNRIQLKH